MAAKPVVVDFLGRNAQLKANLAESSAALRAFDQQIKQGSVSADRLSAANDRWAKGLVLGAKAGAIGMAGVATALGGAVFAATNFDAAMRNVNSIAKLGQGNFKALEQQVLRLAPAIGSSPTDLAKGLYDIVSTGFKASDAIKVLAVSAKAGKAGLTDTATATDAITSALKAYGEGAGSAKKVSDLFFETVDVGKLNFSQLAGSIGTVLAPAATLGVSLKDLGSALASLTLHGVDANTATTQIRGIFTAFEKAGPKTDLAKQFKDWGYASADAGLKSLGLKGSLDKLRGTVEDGSHTWQDYFKDVRALNGAQGLEGTRAAVELYGTSTKAMNEATKGAGATQAAFLEQSKSTAVQFDKLKASIDVAAITIGSALLPELNKGITALSQWLQQAQKSGELQSFAKTIATDVQATVKWLESLGPAAQEAIHIVSSTLAAAIPYAQGLLKVMQEIAPEFEAVGHAATGVTGALGPGPIIGAVGAYLLLNRALLTSSAGMGKYAQIMKAGAAATALSGGGAVSAAGKIDSVGLAAVGASSKTAIFARGLVSTIGTPTLIAAGVAGIVGGILLVRNGMEDLHQAAERAVDALKDVFDARLALKDTTNDVRQAQLNVDKTHQALAPAAAAVKKAQDIQTSRVGAHGQGGNIVDPAVTKALNDQRQAIITYQAALDGLTGAQEKAKQSAAKLADAGDALQKRFGAVTHQVTRDLPIQGAGAGFLGSTASTTAAAGANTRSLQNAAATAQKVFDDLIKKDDDLTASQKKTGLAVGALFNTIGRPPKPAELKIIADDLVAGDSVAKIKSDLGWIASSKTKAKVTPDVAAATAALQTLQAQKDEVTKEKTVKLNADTSLADQALSAFRSQLSGLHNKTLTITELISGGKGKNPLTPTLTPPGQARGAYISGQYGADDVHVRVTGKEAILNPTHIAMVDSGQYTVRGALNATGAPTIHRGSGYAGGGKPAKPSDMKFEAFPLTVYQNRQSNADNALKADRARLKTYSGEFSKIQNAISKAQAKVGTAKTAKTRASYEAAATALERKSQTRLNVLSPLIANQQFQLSQDVPKYQEATRVAKLASGFAAKIKRDQDIASEANSQMQLASDRWSQATTPSGKAAAIAAYQAAQKRRTGANRGLVALLSQAKSTIGDTGSQYFRDTQAAITAAELDQSSNQDVTQTPGYVAPGTSFDSSSLVFLSAADQYRLDQALETDANGNVVNPQLAAQLLGTELANAQRGEAIAAAGGNFDIADSIVQTENGIKSQIAQLSQTAAAPTADVSAQLAQSQGQVLALTRGAGYGAAAASAFSQPGLGMMTILGDPRSVQQLAGYATRGFNAQPFVVQNSGAINV